MKFDLLVLGTAKPWIRKKLFVVKVSKKCGLAKPDGGLIRKRIKRIVLCALALQNTTRE